MQVRPSRTVHQYFVIIFLAIAASFGCSSDGFTSSTSQVAERGKNVGSGGERDAVAEIQIGSRDSLIGMAAQIVKPLQAARLSFGSTYLHIPEHAVPAPVLVTYSLSKGTPPPGLADMPKRIFRFHPDGLVFLRECELVVPFSVLELGDIDPRELRCYYYNPVTRLYEPQPTLVDMRRGLFVVEIRHFSIYGFGRAQ